MKSLNGFPIKSNAFLAGQAILYRQFNDIDFYVEDQDQENLYFLILVKIFGQTVKLAKIFPLNGISNVISQARAHAGNKRKIFIVDRDFSHILRRQVRVPNLFYLKRYSIENYLLEEQAMIEYVIEQKPKLNQTQIIKKLNWPGCVAECFKPYSQIVKVYIIVQKYNLPISNAAQSIEKFCDLSSRPSLRKITFEPYKSLVQSEIRKQNTRLTLKAECKRLEKFFSNHEKKIANLPGKILLLHMNKALQRRFSIQATDKDSFVYRLAKLCKLSSLGELKRRVEAFRT